MKMTIVTDAKGNLVGAVHGHDLVTQHGNMKVGVSFAKDQQLHRVEVEDDMAHITDGAVFHERLMKHMPKR